MASTCMKPPTPILTTKSQTSESLKAPRIWGQKRGRVNKLKYAYIHIYSANFALQILHVYVHIFHCKILSTGRTNCYLWFEIAMRRKMSYHLLQTYLPSVFFLIVTWLCFLIPTKLFEARVGVAAHTDVNVFLD